MRPASRAPWDCRRPRRRMPTPPGPRLRAAMPSRASGHRSTPRLVVAFGDRASPEYAALPGGSMARLVSAVLLVLLPAAASAGELQDDLKARRARVMEALGPEAILVHWSAPSRVFSRDVDYEYRQDSDMLYLTGIGQEDTTLVLMPGNKTNRSILFVSDADPRREHTQGHLLTKKEAQDASGVDEVRL